jgi:NAD(P)-dependent dehydrogenase (short-subunit alcohol dehydrogenase family)
MHPELFSVHGRTALVTGASRGIGSRIASVLDAAGASVILVARSGPDLEEVRGKFQHPSRIVIADLSRHDDCERVVAEAISYTGRVDILVNCAGAGTSSAAIDTPDEEWDLGMSLNLRAAFALARGLAPYMMEVSRGKVINIASVMSYLGNVESAVYTTSKTGLLGLTRALAVEWARKGIQVNALCPGWIDTSMVEALRRDDRFERRVLNRTPARRWGTPEDLDGAVLFLASAASDFMTGQSLVVDGGLLASW